ncbi:MFS transporter [Sinosporangium siamense]|uniref:MFS transporter n=1 Tax=Sinosporangium siamense TaxID=1367973 RepID=A0A919VBG8_9ACTN|nr:MFS transporter [Sinosporangium siamense]GII92089.1 MFS transporter [Sinosporangium siamense]
MTEIPTKSAISPTDLGPERLRVVQRRTLAVLAAAQVTGGVGVAVGLAYSSLIVAKLSGSAAIGGFAGTASVLGAAMLALPIANLAARGGRRPGLATAFAAALAGCLIGVAAVEISSWPLLLAGLVLMGGGSAGGLAARYAATDLSPPGHAGRHLSLAVWALTVGSVIGPNLVGPSLSLSAWAGLSPPAGPFAVAAITALTALLIVAIGLRPDPLVTARRAAGGDIAPKSRPRATRDAWTALKESVNARRALVTIAVAHTAMASIMTMTPVHMDHHGASVTVIGMIISLHIAGMYVFSPIVGWLSDRYGRAPVLVLGLVFLLSAAVIAPAADPHNVPQITAGLTLLGVGWSCALVAGSALLTESVPLERRPAVQGLSDLLMNVCGAGGTLVAGAIVGWWSYATLGIVTSTLVVLCTAWFLLAGRRT